MSTSRRVSGVVIMVLCVVMALVSVGGVVATWQLSAVVSSTFDEVFVAVDSALGTADSGLSLIDSRVAEARARVAEFDRTLADAGGQPQNDGPIRRALDLARSSVVGAITSRLDQATDRVDDALKEIQTAVADRRGGIDARRAEMMALQQRINRWLMTIAVVATLSLAWILLSQAALFVFGLSLYRGENLFDRWLATEAGVLPMLPDSDSAP